MLCVILVGACVTWLRLSSLHLGCSLNLKLHDDTNTCVLDLGASWFLPPKVVIRVACYRLGIKRFATKHSSDAKWCGQWISRTLFFFYLLFKHLSGIVEKQRNKFASRNLCRATVVMMRMSTLNDTRVKCNWKPSYYCRHGKLWFWVFLTGP